MNVITNFENYSGTVFDKNGHNRSNKTIFVSLVSYRDSNIINTIKSILRNAARPENVYLSIAVASFWNHEDWHSEIENIKNTEGGNIVYKSYEVKEISTIGDLKKISDSSYNKEDYYLSVSSSSEFDPNWDDILIKQFEELSEIKQTKKIILTAEPRGFLNHDDVVEGYVFYTNHKTKVSMQREEYDSSYVPICGYSEFVKKLNLSNDIGDEDLEEIDDIEIQKEIRSSKVTELFLKKYGFPKFTKRKFRKDEYLASALGISSKFIFSSAKEYLKDTNYSPTCIDEEDWEFISFINFINSGYTILSIRFVPVYHLYQDDDLFTEKRKSPKDFYEIHDISNSESYQYIKNLISDFEKLDPESRVRMDYLLSIDWENKKFKLRHMQINDTLVSSINSFISLYNFSTNENTLHWNKKWLKN